MRIANRYIWYIALALFAFGGFAWMVFNWSAITIMGQPNFAFEEPRPFVAWGEFITFIIMGLFCLGSSVKLYFDWAKEERHAHDIA